MNADGVASPSSLDAVPSGVSTPKTVTFDLPSSTDQTPYAKKEQQQHFSDLDGESARSHPSSRDFAYDDNQHNNITESRSSRPTRDRHHRRRRSDSLHDYRPDREGRSGRDADMSARRARGRASSPASVRSDDSGDTVELPARFDERGQRKPQPEMGDDVMALKIEDFLSGRNAAGQMFQNVIAQVFNGDDDDDDGGGRGGRGKRNSGRRR